MNKLFELKFGSHLYSTNTPESDTDLKAVYLPSAREIVLGTYPKTINTARPKRDGEKNHKDDVDIEIISLDKYLHQLAEGQTYALDVLFGVSIEEHPVNWYARWVWSQIWDNKEKLICKDVASFISYAKTQAAKYGLKGHRVAALSAVKEWMNKDGLDHHYLSVIDPNTFVNQLQNLHVKMVTQPDKKGVQQTYLEINGKKYQLDIKLGLFRDQINHAWEAYGHRAKLAETNQGVDWKALSHAVRVNSEGTELLRTGHITFPRPDRELLIKIKTGQLPYTEVADIIVQGQAELEEAAKYSTLRAKPDLDWIDNFVEHVYTEIVKKSHKVFEDWEYKKWSPD